MIDSWDQLFDRTVQPIPGSPHFRWVTYRELLPECTPEFRCEVEQVMAVHRAALRLEQMMWQRKYIRVAALKYRARRRRRRARK
jgi:hypothetical protein